MQQLLHGADICLYKAKTAGRDRHFFEELDERSALTA
jgi:PleD family two-component response regulator